MSRIRLYIDEDAAENALVAGLVAAGYDVLTTHQASALGDSDIDQLEFASREGRTIYTLNVDDFARMHASFLASGGNHAGIITIPEQRYSVGEKLRRLLSHLGATSAEDMHNVITYL